MKDKQKTSWTRDEIYEDVKPQFFKITSLQKQDAINKINSLRNTFLTIATISMIVSALLYYISPNATDEPAPLWLNLIINGLILFTFCYLICIRKNIVFAYIFIAILGVNIVLAFLSGSIGVVINIVVLYQTVKAILAIRYLNKS
jgi:hypothetical protein